MKKSGKLLVTLLSAATVSALALTGCQKGGGEPSSSNSGADSAPAKMENIVFSMPSFNRIPSEYGKVVDAINRITESKINVHVDYKLYSIPDYQQKINLALQSGEQMDVFVGFGQLTSLASKGQLHALEDLIPQYGQDLQNLLDQDFGPGLLETTKMNGHIYGIPANKGMSIPINFCFNADILKDVGFTKDDIRSIEDLPKIFEAVKQKYPNLAPFAPTNINPSSTLLTYYLRTANQVDTLTDTTLVGVVVGDSGKVVNFYDTDIFKNGVNMMRDWYNKGYLPKDAATTTLTAGQLIGADKAFSYMAGYGGQAANVQIGASIGKNMEFQRIAPFYFDTGAVNAVSWMLNANTKVPEASMKFLNLVYTDAELLNTILFGIEGEDYVKVDEHHVKYPDGQTADSVPYTAAISSGIIGSESLQYQMEGIPWDDIQLKLDENKSTTRSPYFGFIFDPSNVKNEMTAINNVINQYIPGLETGSLDPETAMPKFLNALNQAGAAKVIAEKQKQLDAWIAENKK
jgi:putative aldouronate transport system substrate-binding protein